MSRPNLHILMFAMGTAGDVYPYVGIGRSLRERGHRVTVVANAWFERVVRSAGLEFRSSGPAEDYLQLIENPDLWTFPTGYRLMFAKILDAMEVSWRIIASHPADGNTVLVAPSAAFGPRIANEKLQIPLVSLNIETNIFRSAYELPGHNLPRAVATILIPFRKAMMAVMDDWFFDPLLLPRLNAFRAELGLTPIRRVMRRWLHSPQCVIGLFPEWFSPRQPDWPPGIHLTGFPLFDESHVRQTPPALEQFLAGGEPPVVFTLGTGMRFVKSFFETSVDVCRRLNRRGILLTQFREQVPAALPDFVRHFDYLPFSRLLPRVAALVHHGGIGTVAQALCAGVPQLIVPFAFDQPHNAARLRRLGVAQSVKPSEYRLSVVAGKLKYLLNSSQVFAQCCELAALFSDTAPVARTCDLIESAACATSRSPGVRRLESHA